ncbi:PLC-like phosphodiesterase [Massariosphaeria phaeospora]|uniref:PLC-like phosphodiesterase n=1 Tax=Massariosphaeria phaeospora TaxID=100035 RepID=A0A7C8MDU2_9PLEO|nr:PLC-like phosphodiesterase [Massariosphaeria phaeospora]
MYQCYSPVLRSSTDIREIPSSRPLITITGSSTPTFAPNATASGISSVLPRPTNRRACNGHVEFCDRKFSNITMVVAHNSPFDVPHNLASNQELGVIAQLEDSIRGLQFQTHWSQTTSQLRLCHTSCNLLDAGTLQSFLQTVHSWLVAHPYEVIAIIMGNDDRVSPTTYIEPFNNSGLLPHLYVAPNTTMTVKQWPTLSEMIIHDKRVVVMLDYLANQTQVPWLLDEFNYLWETPFSPTDAAFPCTQQRPPDQTEAVSLSRMYMANHNLNVDVPFREGKGLLMPALALLHQVNAVSGDGSLGHAVHGCTTEWGRPPNWLLVDHYNRGNFPGSVFQVAATANNVSYNRTSCCRSMPESTAYINESRGSGVLSATTLVLILVVA